MSSDLKRAIAANQQAVLDLSKPSLKLILPVLEQIRDEAAKKLAKLLDDKKSAVHHSQSVAQRAYLAQVGDAILVAESQLGVKTFAQLTKSARALTPGAIAKIQLQIDAGNKAHRPAMKPIKFDHARILLSEKLSVAHRYKASAKRYSGRVGARIRHDLALGVLSGKSPDEIAKSMLGKSYSRLKNKSASKKADAVVEANFFKNEADAMRLVRTEMNGAHNRIQLQTIVEAERSDPGWLKLWDATHDLRLCVECRLLDGKTAPIHGVFPGTTIQYPPLHPNDRCSIVPVRADWKDPR